MHDWNEPGRFVDEPDELFDKVVDGVLEVSITVSLERVVKEHVS